MVVVCEVLTGCASAPSSWCIVDTAASSAFVRASGIVVAVAHPQKAARFIGRCPSTRRCRTERSLFSSRETTGGHRGTPRLLGCRGPHWTVMHPPTRGGSVPSVTDHFENVVVQCTDTQSGGERLRGEGVS